VSSTDGSVNSGPIGLEIEAAKFYVLAVGWEGTVTTAMEYDLTGESVGWGTSRGWTSDNSYSFSGYDGDMGWSPTGTYEQVVNSECTP
jgi:hypothetical protein